MSNCNLRDLIKGYPNFAKTASSIKIGGQDYNNWPICAKNL